MIWLLEEQIVLLWHNRIFVIHLLGLFACVKKWRIIPLNPSRPESITRYPDGGYLPDLQWTYYGKIPHHSSWFSICNESKSISKPTIDFFLFFIHIFVILMHPPSVRPYEHRVFHSAHLSSYLSALPNSVEPNFCRFAWVTKIDRKGERERKNKR